MSRGRNRIQSVQRASTEETRRAILRAARDLFMRLGYRAVTTRMVAEASGIKQPLIYYHFADKETLYLEMRREESTATQTALARIASRQHESVPERLCQIVRYLRLSSPHNMGLFFYELEHEMSPGARSTLKEFFQISIVEPIHLLFEEGVRVGFLRSSQQGGVAPRLASYLLLSAISSLNTSKQGENELWQDDHALAPNDDPAKVIVDALIYGMAVHPSALLQHDP